MKASKTETNLSADIPTKGIRGHWPGAVEALSSATSLIRKYPQITLAYIALNVLVVILPAQFPGLQLHPTWLGQLKLEINFLSIALWFLAASILIVYALLLIDRKSVSWNSFQRYGLSRYVRAGLTASLLVGMLLLSTLLLLVPVPDHGIVLFAIGALILGCWLTSQFAMAVFYSADHNLNPIKALKASQLALRQNQRPLWGIIGLFIVLSLAASVISSLLDQQIFSGTPVVKAITDSIVDTLLIVCLGLLYRWIQKTTV
jgi:hypothetical protein